MAEVAAAYADGFPVDVVLDGCSSVVDVWCVWAYVLFKLPMLH